METSELIKFLIALGIALALAAGIGWLDLHSEEVQTVLVGLLGASFALSFVQPRWFAVWCAIMGLSVPAAHGIARACAFHLPYELSSMWATFLALVPAALGAGLGAGTRFATRELLHVRRN